MTYPCLQKIWGIITPEVEALRDRFSFPGMRILLFAFGEGPDSIYLPHHYIQNAVVYTGTHDNDTTLGWWKSTGDQERQFLAQYLGLSSEAEITDINRTMIRLALASVANSVIIPLQDLLDLDNQARMNDPSVSAGNWRWRYASSDLLTPELSQQLLQITQLYSRTA